MSRIECGHVKYCENCDRYHCSNCGCACRRGLPQTGNLNLYGELTRELSALRARVKAGPSEVWTFDIDTHALLDLTETLVVALGARCLCIPDSIHPENRVCGACETLLRVKERLHGEVRR